MSSHTGWETRVRQLAAERDAVILAHNYQRPEIQDVADHVGDSLALARLAATSTARTIILAGVYFMAETAKILSPQRTVLIPDANAGCSLADSITADQLREWKREHPGAVVVAYVNTSAEVKAESDVCCTSANAADIVAAIPADRARRSATPSSSSGSDTFSAAVSPGSRLNSWNTYPITRRRSLALPLCDSFASSAPHTRTSPLVGSSRLPAIVSSVDLPDPLGPITATISPARTDRLTRDSACTTAASCP